MNKYNRNVLIIGFVILIAFNSCTKNTIPVSTQTQENEISIASPITHDNKFTNTPIQIIPVPTLYTPTITLTTTTVPNGVSSIDNMTLIYIPAGEFLMGITGENLTIEIEKCLEKDFSRDLCEIYYTAENPQHTVYLDAYWIDQTEVTNSMFVEFLNTIGWKPFPEDDPWINLSDKVLHHHKTVYSEGRWYVESGFEDHPIVEVAWDGAVAYCEWVGRRLPTEAEWEKAARSTDGRTYSWGEEEPNCGLVNHGNINYEPCDEFYIPVDRLPNGASPYGVLNMTGNAEEWVADWFNRDYYDISPLTNPLGPNSGELRVVRGSSVGTIPGILRVTYRSGQGPWDRSIIGFRCAQNVGAEN